LIYDFDLNQRRNDLSQHWYYYGSNGGDTPKKTQPLVIETESGPPIQRMDHIHVKRREIDEDIILAR